MILVTAGSNIVVGGRLTADDAAVTCVVAGDLLLVEHPPAGVAVMSAREFLARPSAPGS